MASTETEPQIELVDMATWKRSIPAHIRERFEVIDGRLMEKDVTLPPHGTIVLDLAYLLRDQAPGLRLSSDVIVFFADPETGGTQECHPDLAGVHRTNPVPWGADAYRGVPDLVVEVASRSTRTWDRTRKAEISAGAGVPHYWLVDPRARTVEALRLDPATGAYATAWEGALEDLQVPPGLR